MDEWMTHGPDTDPRTRHKQSYVNASGKKMIVELRCVTGYNLS